MKPRELENAECVERWARSGGRCMDQEERDDKQDGCECKIHEELQGGHGQYELGRPRVRNVQVQHSA